MFGPFNSLNALFILNSRKKWHSNGREIENNKSMDQIYERPKEQINDNRWANWIWVTQQMTMWMPLGYLHYNARIAY